MRRGIYARAAGSANAASHLDKAAGKFVVSGSAAMLARSHFWEFPELREGKLGGGFGSFGSFGFGFNRHCLRFVKSPHYVRFWKL